MNPYGNQSKKDQIKSFMMRLGQGFAMGATVGGIMGLVTGGMVVLTSGPAPGKTFAGTIGGQMRQMGGWFGLMMGVGSVIRGQELNRNQSNINLYPSSAPITIISTKQYNHHHIH